MRNFPEPNEVWVTVELLQSLFAENPLDVSPPMQTYTGPALEAKIVGVRLEDGMVIFTYDRPVDQPLFRSFAFTRPNWWELLTK